jgi:O-antigen/teichoic acid export membrane protein
MSAHRPAIAPAARRMTRNVRATLLGNVVYAVGLWIQLVIFARIGGPAAVGAYAFALSLVAPVMMLSYLQLRMLLASDPGRTYSFREYRAVRLVTTAAALAAMIPVAWWSGPWRALWPVLAPVCAKAAADALLDVYCGLWQQHERMGVVGLAFALNAVTSVSLMVAATLLRGSVPAVATASALGSCTALLFVHLRTAWDAELRGALLPDGRIEWRRLARLVRDAAPLGVIVLLGSLRMNVPRYFIQHHAGQAALGLYAAAYQLTAAGDLFVHALGVAATPRLARACLDGDAAGFRAVTRRIVALAALLGVLGIAISALVGRQVLALVFRPEFGSAAGLLVVLSAAAGVGFAATLLGYALTAARVIAVQPVLLSATLAIACLGCAALVPAHGAAGAAWSLVLAAVVQAAWSAVALRRFRVRPAPATTAVELA